PSRRQRRLTRDEQTQIIADYRAGTAIVELARLHGVRPSTISDVLRRHGIERKDRRQQPSDKIDDAARLYNAGWPLSRLAAEFNVAPNTLRSRLLEAGVEMRKPQERPNSPNRERNLRRRQSSD